MSRGLWVAAPLAVGPFSAGWACFGSRLLSRLGFEMSFLLLPRLQDRQFGCLTGSQGWVGAGRSCCQDTGIFFPECFSCLQGTEHPLFPSGGSSAAGVREWRAQGSCEQAPAAMNRVPV